MHNYINYHIYIHIYTYIYIYIVHIYLILSCKGLTTVLLHSGQSIAFIGKQLGHTDTKTTESYLKSFDIEAKREANEALTSFK